MLLCALITNAQTFTEISLPSEISDKNLFSIKNYKNTLFVAGDNILIKSTDEGVNWQIMLQSDTVCFYDVEFYNDTIGFAVGLNKQYDHLNRRAHFYSTHDGGNTWFCYTPPEHLSSNVTTVTSNYEFPDWSVRNGSISVLNENRVVAVAGNGYYYSSTGGRAYYWLPKVTALSVYYKNADQIYYSGFGLMRHDMPLGTYGVDYYQSLLVFDIDFVSENIGFAVKQSDFGETKIICINGDDYTQKTINVGELNLYGVDFINENEGVAVGQNGTILKTLDNADNFTSLDGNTTEQLNRVLVYNNNTVFVVGNNGVLLKSNDFDFTGNIQNGKSPELEVSNWNIVENQYDVDFHCVEIEENNSFVSGQGVILKSSDFGNNWSLSYEDTDLDFTNITFVNDNVGWAGGINSEYSAYKILKTIDGGVSWQQQYEVPLEDNTFGRISPPLIKARDENLVFIAIPYHRYYSVDGGQNWTELTSYVNLKYFDILDNDYFIGIYMDACDYIFTDSYTNANYTMWTGPTGGCSVNDDDTQVDGNKFGFVKISENEYRIYTATNMYDYGPSVAKHYNNDLSIGDNLILGGSSNPFITKKTYIPTNMNSISVTDIDTIWLAGDNGIIAKTTTAGLAIEDKNHKIWSAFNSNAYDKIKDIEIVENNGIAVGENGLIVKTNCAYEFEKPIIDYNSTSNTLSVSNNYSSYQWYYGGVEIDEALNNTTEVNKTGSFSVIVTNSQGCKISSEPYTFQTATNIEEITVKSNFTVFPNPTSDFIILKSLNNYNSDIHLSLFDITGKEYSVSIINSNSNEIKIDLRNYMNGIYSLKIKTSNTTETLKIIKIK